METVLNWIKSHLVIVIAAAVVLLLALILFLVNNGVTNTGNKREAGLNAQYLDNQNYLSDCLVKIRETANVTSAEADRFESVMVEVIKGRYEDRSPNPGSMFSAIIEDYPDLAPLSAAYERVHTVVVGCRTDYRDIQSKLLDELRSYDAWRTGSFTVRTFGGEYPSDNLEARVGTDVKTGTDARNAMYTIVLVKDAKDAYEDGEIEVEDPFAGDTE
mgnify:CR=1 FL=1